MALQKIVAQTSKTISDHRPLKKIALYKDIIDGCEKNISFSLTFCENLIKYLLVFESSHVNIEGTRFHTMT